MAAGETLSIHALAAKDRCTAVLVDIGVAS
jgi:hypothetical protein